MDGDFNLRPVCPKKRETVYVVDVAVCEDGCDGIKLVFL